MLTLKNIRKTYKSKKGSECTALNGINVDFPDKGMVFILGKSGSGKSTLLNVVGGLDAPDEGEIIIKGKSSLDFTAKDYDSYRNTYLGFIFQEYNVMDDFSVYDNVALALRLQGRKAEKESVTKILNQVGLEGYENRKPNELSGGQKQRVAIARALVKEPEIIFGDEPTGNLDSNTSAQIFGLLRELAQEKLVVIVSHDRESAERYADRIIELADGFVISDLSRGDGANKDFSVSKELITIPKYRELTDDEVEDMNKAISASKGKVKVSQTSGNFKTTDKVINNKKEGFKLIKSRLPNKFAAAIGVSNFRTKKFRLVVTIFLTVVALSLFGLSQIFSSYDLPTASATSFDKNNITEIIAKKGEYNEEFGSFSRRENEITNEDYERIKQNFPNLKIDEFYGFSISIPMPTSGSMEDRIMGIMMSMMGKSLLTPYITSTNGVLVLSEQNLAKYYKNGNEVVWLQGGYPTNDDEVVITDYLADSILSYVIALNIPLPTDPLNRYSRLMNGEFQDDFGFALNISGIINTGYKTKYADLIDSYMKNPEDFTSHADYENFAHQATNYYSCVIASSKTYVDNVINEYVAAKISGYKIRVEGSTSYPRGLTKTRYSFKVDKLLEYGYTKEHLYGDNLNNDIYVSAGAFDALENPAINNPIVLPLSEYISLFNLENTFTAADFDLNQDPKHIEMGFFSGYAISADAEVKKTVSLTVVGVVDLAKIAEEHPELAAMQAQVLGFLPDEFVEDYNTHNFSLKGLYVTLPTGVNNVERFLRLLDNNYMYHISELSDTIYMVSSIFDIFAIIFQWVALILGIFSVILLFNFVSLSVLNKQKEIGILRAIGTKGTDVSKIFLIEAMIIAAITVVCSWLLIFLGTWGVNALLIDNFKGFLQSTAIEKIALLSAGILPLLAVMAACVIITLVATIIPTIKISKMKPVDAIKKL